MNFSISSETKWRSMGNHKQTDIQIDGTEMTCRKPEKEKLTVDGGHRKWNIVWSIWQNEIYFCFGNVSRMKLVFSDLISIDIHCWSNERYSNDVLPFQVSSCFRCYFGHGKLKIGSTITFLSRSQTYDYKNVFKVKESKVENI